jgi:phenylacetate-CoA ligase
LIETLAPTVVCTRTALRLAEVAAASRGVDLPGSSVRVLIVAGEPGKASVDARWIERAWGARVIDHHGLTEVGPVGFECWEAPGFLHLNECDICGAGPIAIAKCRTASAASSS